MTTQWQGGQTLVNRLRVRGRGLDPTLTQLRLASLLGSAPLSPSGLAPSAILCVRRLRDPLPRTLPLHRTTGGITRPHAWERAVASSLEELARSAARPALHQAHANAEAVLFADHAELLACLAADWCDSLAASRWWWRSLFRGTDATAALMPALRAAPAYLPAALEHLSRAGKAEKFALSLGVADARSLLFCLTRSFSLPRLHTALDKAFNGVGRAPYPADAAWAQEDDDTQPRMEASQVSMTASTPPPAPWQQHVPESVSQLLKPEQRALLGIGLLLLRAPSLARSDAFARDTQNWLQGAAHAEDQRAAFAQASVAQHAPPRLSTFQTSQTETQKASVGETDSRPPGPFSTTIGLDEGSAPPSHVKAETVRPSMEKHAGPGAFEEAAFGEAALEEAAFEEAAGAHQSALTENESDTADSSSSAEPLSEDVEDRAIERYEIGPTPEAFATAEAAAPDFETLRPSAARAYEAYIETKLGGIFYLINVALFLELYGDFTTPAAPGLSLDIWDFLSLFGAELNEKFYEDPIDKLLRRMAGRAEDEAAGQGFEPPREWRIAPLWLASFPERTACEWTAREGRLRVRHAEGFFILDVPLKDDEAHAPDADRVRARLLHEMEAYRECADLELRLVASRELSRVACERDALQRWLGWLVPFVCARLRRALPLAEDEAPLSFLFEQAARVRVSATHLDVFFELAALPLEIRLAGIDRDPGWVPAAGRHIAFHYE